MSWHYLQAVEEASWEANSLAGAPGALLKLIPTAEGYYSPDNVMEFSTHSQFGTMFEHSTAGLGGGTSTSLLGGSPVRTSVAPEKAQESQENAADCGKSLPGSFARWDQASCSWKTHQCSLLGDWEPFSETWPRWGMMQNGECWELMTPVPHIAENEFGFWPTPRCQMTRPVAIRAGRHRSNLETFVAEKLLPTPTARDWRSGKASQETMERNSRPLSEVVGGLLNPTWVEWLIGWPLGWSDCAPLGMDKYQQWLRSHGTHSQEE